MNFEKLDEILGLEDAIHYVGIMDSMGNIITNKIKKGITTEHDEEMYRMDLLIIKNMLDIYNPSFGKTLTVQTVREKITQLVFYHDYMIIYIACDPTVDKNTMLKISNKAGELIKELMH